MIILDVICSNTFIAKLKGKKSQEIEVKIISCYFNTMILPLLSQIANISFTEQEVEELTKYIQNTGTEVVKTKASGGSATLYTSLSYCMFDLSLVNALNSKNIIDQLCIRGK